ncbi:MAG: PEPxxWA-CTERM sorting domain-containing protein [Alphaproteobacteria bacterium]
MKKFVHAALIASGLALAASGASAGAIVTDQWYEFRFGAAGTFADTCVGYGCVPTAAPTTYADVPPWTFTSPTEGSVFTVTDAFLHVDRFEIFDFGVSLGLTSLESGSGTCGDDPVTCLGDANASSGVFNFGAGAHEITIKAVDSGAGGGAAYFLLANAVPEPATWGLMILGFAGLGFARRRSLVRA